MGASAESITPELHAFIEAQHVFFVATAPAGAGGHVNLSPKGLDSLRVLAPRRVAYLDLTGSGNETAAHLIQNGRITFMFCAFEGPPRIVRVYGRGRVVAPGSAEWAALAGAFATRASFRGVRQIIVVEVEMVRTSCGFAVPLMEFVGERDSYHRWAQAKDDDGLRAFREKHNRVSVDGLPTQGGAESAAD